MAVALRDHVTRSLSWWDNIFEHWLGYNVPPAERAVSDAEFAADDPTKYCSRCGDSVGEGEATATGCASCRHKLALADGIVRLSTYAGDLREWVVTIKYERWSAMAEHLGRMLGTSIALSSLFDPANAYVVPMPMPWQRRLYRGIDHTAVIASAAAREIDAPVVRVLTRTHGPPQVTLSPTDRFRLGGRTLRVCKRFGGWVSPAVRSFLSMMCAPQVRQCAAQSEFFNNWIRRRSRSLLQCLQWQTRHHGVFAPDKALTPDLSRRVIARRNN